VTTVDIDDQWGATRLELVGYALIDCGVTDIPFFSKSNYSSTHKWMMADQWSAARILEPSLEYAQQVREKHFPRNSGMHDRMAIVRVLADDDPRAVLDRAKGLAP